MLACVLIPNSKPIVEFCDFISEFDQYLQELKVLRLSLMNYYSILLYFDNGMPPRLSVLFDG